MRLACLDIGTNSILLLVADVVDGKLTPLVDESEITRIGKGVDAEKRLRSEAIQQSLTAVERFSKQARDLGAERIVAVGTSALRDASNAPEFLVPAEQFIGEGVQVIPGELEAECSWMSVAGDHSLNLPTPASMADVGGGSTELVVGDETSATFRKSIDMGAVRLTERFLSVSPHLPESIIQAKHTALEAFQETLSLDAKALVAIGGTGVNLATMIRGNSHTEVHAAAVTRHEIQEAIRNLSAITLEERKNAPGLEPKRADVIVAGAVIFDALLESLKLSEMKVSIRGARFGVLTKVAAGQWL